MNLTEVKKLQCGDTFQRPSRDGGWVIYTVIGCYSFEESEIYDEPGVVSMLNCIDEHGYHYYIALTDWNTSQSNSKKFMRNAI